MCTVKGESTEDSKRRALDVIHLLRQAQQPGLWRHVSGHFVMDGKLDLSNVLTNTRVPDLEYLFASGVASDVTNLE